MRRFPSILRSAALTAALTVFAAGDPLVAGQAGARAPAVQKAAPQQPEVHQLPNEKDSVKFAVIGDSGTGDRAQYAVGARLEEAWKAFPFTFAIMLGDNLYGSERPQDYEQKFEKPYAPLLSGGVKFYAALGNHDDPNQRYYKPFNMDGKQYYTFKQGPARFFVLDSNYLDQDQLTWLQQELSSSREPWKVAYFHHPLYSSGERHGSEDDLRERLEPLFKAHGVSVVFAGHEHFYERIKPQHGIAYFISGGSAKLRAGNIRDKSPLTVKGFDTDRSFMLVEIAGDQMHFQTISRTGTVVDSGSVTRVQHQAEPSSR
jgi:predicted phosphodiesterase